MNRDPLIETFLRGLNSSLREDILSCGIVENYELGEALSSYGSSSDRVSLIVSGQARLLIDDGRDWIEVAKLAPGNWVGLSSILAGFECEEVSACSRTVTLSIPRDKACGYIEDTSFYETFCSSVLPAERANILLSLWESEFSAFASYEDFLNPVNSIVRVEDFAALAEGSTNLFLATDSIDGVDYCTRLTQDWLRSCETSIGANVRLLSIEISANYAELRAAKSSSNSDIDSDSSDVLSEELAGYTRKDDALLKIRKNLTLFSDPLDIAVQVIKSVAGICDVRFMHDATINILIDAQKRRGALDLSILAAACEFHGLQVTQGYVSQQLITRIETPSIVSWENDYAVIYEAGKEWVLLISPKSGILRVPSRRLWDNCDPGSELRFIHIERGDESPTNSFGVRWFVPFLRRYRKPLLIVLFSSFIIQILGLIGPLLVQVIIDKVISQRSINSLQVLGYSLIIVTLLEGALGSLRTFLFTQTTNKIDLQIGARVIDRLLRLPLNYFDARAVGELSSRLSELEKIRSFLTGQVLTTSLDALLSTLYIVAMVIYSLPLTLVALSVLPLQIALTLLGAPIFRAQYRDAAQKNARTQSHLVEVLTGIQTVKSQNIESIARSKWQSYYSRYISSSFNKVISGTTLSEATQMLQKLSQLFVLWFGARLVLEGQITLGQLIAFRIISGYVTQPLLRLSSIWQSVQELKISFERLSDIVDTPQEGDIGSRSSNISIPPISGHIEFKKVSFNFPGTSKTVLSDISLNISSGEFVGVVGKSGSGKSSLAKLIARLFTPSAGSIYMDGFDITKVELYSYRRQIGMVPQEPLLFNGTIFENITLGCPDATNEDVVSVAKIAYAHDFIMSSSDGYNTNVGERGLSLSGGQRQRIALARTLLTKPRFLILDEATSALDYYTENHVFKNLRSHLRGTTVIFITHRLSTMPLADKVIVMDSGNLVESGTHTSLIESKGQYFALIKNQDSSL